MRPTFGFILLPILSLSLAAIAQAQAPAPARPEAAPTLPVLSRPPATKGASAEERTRLMETWRQQNRAPFEALQEIARSKPRAEVPMILQVEIPETASPAMEELIVQRVQLRNERAKLANTLRDATPESRAAAVRQWHDRNQATLLALHDQAAAVAAESRQLLLPLPPPLRIPDGASSSLQNFMAERHARLRQSIEQENRVRRLSLGEQGAARQLLRSQKTPPAFLSFPPGESISQPESPTPSYP